MIAGDPPASAVALSIDNVWWEPSAPRETPADGNFGIYTETASHKDAGEFGLGEDGQFFVWEQTLVDNTQTPFEGAESVSLKSAPGQTWFGCAFTPNRKYNLTAFRYPESKLCFSLKTSSSTAFRVGMKSGNIAGVGQKWISFTSGSDPYGFVRDGQCIDRIRCQFHLKWIFEVSVLKFYRPTVRSILNWTIFIDRGGSPQIGDSNPPSVGIIRPANGDFCPGENVTIRPSRRCGRDDCQVEF